MPTEPLLKDLRAEVMKVKTMFMKHTHKMSRDECNWFLSCFKELYTPLVPISAGVAPKPKKKYVEEYDF